MLNKIFGIGLSRTGTTSLTCALRALGYKAIHYPPVPRLQKILSRYHAATDTPVAVRFAELDRDYPGSKFILTVRDVDGWLASTRKMWARNRKKKGWELDLRYALYGTAEWDRDKFSDAYLRHYHNVTEYFKGRPDDLLILDIFKGQGYGEICKFLNVPDPGLKFPHKNKTGKIRMRDIFFFHLLG